MPAWVQKVLMEYGGRPDYAVLLKSSNEPYLWLYYRQGTVAVVPSLNPSNVRVSPLIDEPSDFDWKNFGYIDFDPEMFSTHARMLITKTVSLKFFPRPGF